MLFYACKVTTFSADRQKKTSEVVSLQEFFKYNLMKHLLCHILFLLCWQMTIAQTPLPPHQLLERLTRRPIVPARNEGSQAPSAVPTRPSAKKAPVSSSLPSRVEPLLANINLWHQYGPPYWNMTPILDGQHCPVGCVALAMGQVMHYWHHPTWGEGSHTYIDSLGCGETLTADFGAHHYDWSKMLYEYDSRTYTDEEAAPMAQLLSDCGISVNMKYRASESGARSVMQPIALMSYFRYDRGAQLHYRDFYSREEITHMLKTELAAGRPVLTSGYNYNGGHAFVIDGYNADDWFHIMLGNPGGEGDGWTTLDCMNGDHDEGDPSLDAESGLNLVEMFVTGVQPCDAPSATGKEAHLYAMEGLSTTTPQVARTETIKLRVAQLANIGCNLHHDSVTVMLTQDDHIVERLYTYQRTFALEEVEDTCYTDTLTFPIAPTVAKGDYHLMVMYRDQDTWTEVRTNTGIPNYLLCHVDDEAITLANDTDHTAFLTMEDLDIPDFIIHGTAPEVAITLTNHNAESSGRIYFLMEPTNGEDASFYLYSQSFYLAAEETQTYNFRRKKIWAPQTGEYRLRIVYDNNLLASELMELTDPEQPIFVTVQLPNHIQIAQR